MCLAETLVSFLSWIPSVWDEVCQPAQRLANHILAWLFLICWVLIVTQRPTYLPLSLTPCLHPSHVYLLLQLFHSSAASNYFSTHRSAQQEISKHHIIQVHIFQLFSFLVLLSAFHAGLQISTTGNQRTSHHPNTNFPRVLVFCFRISIIWLACRWCCQQHGSQQ